MIFELNWYIVLILFFCTYTDLKNRKVYNWVSWGLILFGAFYSFTLDSYMFKLHWLVFISATALSLAMYVSKSFAEGDGKLLMGIAPFIGSWWLINFYVILFVVTLVWIAISKIFKLEPPIPLVPAITAAYLLLG